jgi:hypothetical protein
MQAGRQAGRDGGGAKSWRLRRHVMGFGGRSSIQLEFNSQAGLETSIEIADWWACTTCSEVLSGLSTHSIVVVVFRFLILCQRS